MGRILAIDYGRKRTGLAVTDTLQIIANGLETVPTHTLMQYLKNYMAKEPVDTIVVGLPKQLNGQHGKYRRRDLCPSHEQLDGWLRRRAPDQRH